MLFFNSIDAMRKIKLINLRSLLFNLSVYLPLSLALLSSNIAWSAQWPNFPTPEKGKVTIVAESMEYNGVPMKTWELKSNENVENILQFYRDLWESEGSRDAPGFIETNLGEWKIISHKKDHNLFTVQVSKTEMNGSFTLLGLSKLPDLNLIKNPGETFPKLAGSEVQTDIISHDAGRASRTVMFTNPHTTESNKRFYRDYYIRRGWLEQSNSAYTTQALILMKGDDEVNMTFSRKEKKEGQRGTQVIAIIVN